MTITFAARDELTRSPYDPDMSPFSRASRRVFEQFTTDVNRFAATVDKLSNVADRLNALAESPKPQAPVEQPEVKALDPKDAALEEVRSFLKASRETVADVVQFANEIRNLADEMKTSPASERGDGGKLEEGEGP